MGGEKFEIKNNASANKAEGSILEKKLYNFDLSIRTVQFLKANNVLTLGDLANQTLSDLEAMRGVSKYIIKEIREILTDKNIPFKGDKTV